MLPSARRKQRVLNAERFIARVKGGVGKSQFLTDGKVKAMSDHPQTWWGWTLGVGEKTVERITHRTHPATPLLDRLITLILSDPGEAELMAESPSVTAEQLELRRERLGISQDSFALLLACSPEHYSRSLHDPETLKHRKRSFHILGNWIISGLDS